MELNTATLPVFTQLAGVMFEEGKEMTPAVARQSGLFKVETITAGSGDTRQYTEIDRNEYASFKGQSDQAARSRIQQGYTKTLTLYRIAENTGISWEMRQHNKYPEVVDRLTGLGQALVNRIELDLSHRIGFGTATSYTDKDGRVVDLTLGDGKSLFATDHTLSGSATTFRNRLANNPRFSRGALEAIERQGIENAYNHLGEKVTMTFDLLWSTDDPNTVNTIREFLKSTAAPEQANAGVTNVYQGRYRHVILPRLATSAAGAPDTTKRYYWGIASSRHSTAHLAVGQEPSLMAPSANTSAEDAQTDDWDFRGRGEIGLCIVTAPWIHMSSGDGA